MYRDKEEILEIFEEIYARNVQSKDVEGYANMYVEDALWMAPDARDRYGIPDIIEGFIEMISSQDIHPTFTASEIEIIAYFGYVIGTSEATIYPHNGGEPKVKKFTAMWLMKKEQDSWKIARQMWNGTPLPTP
ncbi:DUF4440 domain-containing protein [Oscillatoria sp. FACHB-1406]|uniref:YybH family protein n=1 Tax=Oscillatoria sp. FACHB-1406 TaxID=2692846 RepID=UPI001686E328|nr:DUF4440 domain-containing protein [Oscillatoria sp. FACHB-1406]MBD2578382.1 DUF4440 domain-containing protein [Oscillatoria sp. FACHB-1406]